MAKKKEGERPKQRPPCVECGGSPGTRAGGRCTACHTKWLKSQAAPAAVATATEMRPVAGLKPHPLNAEIYRRADDTFAGLAEQMAAGYDHSKPIKVSLDGYILGGHRRVGAARLAGIGEAPCSIVPVMHDTPEALRVLLEDNLGQRAKTNEDRAREAVEWWPFVEEEAAARSGERTDLLDKYPGGSDDDEGAGNTRDIVARKVGFGSGRTCQDAINVVRRYDHLIAKGDGRIAGELLARLEESPQAAAKMMREWEHPAPRTPAAVPANETPPTQAADKEFVQELAGPADVSPPADEDADAEDGGPPDEGLDDHPADLQDDGSPGDTPTTGEAGVSPGPGTDAPEPLLDPQRIPLDCQPGALEAFAAADQYAQALAAIRPLKRLMSSIAKGAAGAKLQAKMRRETRGDELVFRSVDLENAELALSQSIPACCRCPHCHGRGHRRNQAACGVCRGLPFVTAWEWAQAGAALTSRVVRDLGADQKEVA